MVFSANSHLLKCYDAKGSMRRQVRAIGYGTLSDYTQVNGNTPPGLYRCGVPESIESGRRDGNRFGPWLVDLE